MKIDYSAIESQEHPIDGLKTKPNTSIIDYSGIEGKLSQDEDYSLANSDSYHKIDYSGIEPAEHYNTLAVSHKTPLQILNTMVPHDAEDTRKIWHPQQEVAAKNLKPPHIDPVKLFFGGFSGGVANTVGETLKGIGYLLKLPKRAIDYALGVENKEAPYNPSLLNQLDPEEMGKNLVEGAKIVGGEMNPVSFLTQTAGSVASFFFPAALASKLGMTPKVINFLMTTAEALGEASSARDRRIEIAKNNGSANPEAEGDSAFWTALVLNEGLGYATNKLAYFNDAISMPKSILGEAAQEITQTAISDIAARQLSSPEEYGLSALGGAIGGAMAHGILRLVDRQAQIKDRVGKLKEVPENVRNVYTEAYNNAIQNGLDDRKAHQIATSSILNTEDGQDYVRDIIDTTKDSLATIVETEAVKRQILDNKIDKQLDAIIQNKADPMDIEIPLDDEELDKSENQHQGLINETESPITSINGEIFKSALGKLGIDANAKHIHIIKSTTELPANIQANVLNAKERNKIVEAVYDKATGDVYYITDNISPDRVNYVIKHELIHRAERHTATLEEMFGKNTEEIRRQLSNKYFESISRKMQNGLNAQDAFSETLAELADSSDTIGESKLERIKTYIKELVAKSRLYLRAKGIKMDWTENDVVALLNRLVKEGAARKSNGSSTSSGILTSMNESNESEFGDFMDFFAKKQDKFVAPDEKPLDMREILLKDYDTLSDRERNFLNNAMDDYLESSREIKPRINKITGVTKVSDLVREDEALKAGLTKAVIAARIAYKQGNAEGVAKAKANIKELLAKARMEAQMKYAKEAASEKEKTVKQSIREITGQTRTDKPVSEAAALKETFRQSEKASKTAYREGKKEGIQEAKTKFKEKQAAESERAKAKELEAKLDEQIKYLARINPNIALGFQKKIIELTSGLNLKSNSLKPIHYKMLKETIDAIENPADIGMSSETFDEIKNNVTRMLRKYSYAFNKDGSPKQILANMSNHDKLELIDMLKRLRSTGRLLREFELAERIAKRDILRKQLINSTVNLDQPKQKFSKGDRRPTGRAFKEMISEGNLKTLDAYRAADRIDGFKEHGINKQFVIEHFIKATNSEFTAHEESRILLDTLKGIKEEWTEDELKRITLVGAQRMGGVSQAETFAKEHGLALDIKLTNEEEKFLDVLSEYYKNKVHDYAATYEARENKPFPKREVYYFPFSYEADTLRNISEDYARRDISRTSKTESGSTIERKEGVDNLLRPDLLNVVLESIEQINWYIHMQPLLDVHASVLFNEEFRKHAGELVYNWWKDELDVVARHGQMAGRTKMPRLASLMKGQRINLSKAIMAFKISSTLVQFLSVFNGMAYALSKGMYGAAARMPFTLIREFTRIGDSAATKASKELTLRQAGEFAYAELIKTMESKITKAGFYFMKRFDLKTAAAVQRAFNLSLTSTLPKQEAENLAELYTALSQGSANVALMPQILASGELAKTILTFENFSLYTWNMISHDFIYKGLVKGSAKQKIQALSALYIMAIAKSVTDKLQELIYESITGKSIPETKSKARQLLAIIPSYIPVFGKTLSDYIEKGRAETPIPAIGRIISQFAKGLNKIFTGKETAEIMQGAAKMLESVIIIKYGAPGTAQIFDIIERYLPKTEKQKKLIEKEARYKEIKDLYGENVAEEYLKKKKRNQQKPLPSDYISEEED